MSSQSGITLTEVLVSLFIANILMLILTQFYFANKRQYLAVENHLEANFDLQWVSELLSDSIRRAGFTPCVSIDKVTSSDRRDKDRSIQSVIIENAPQQSIKINRMSELFAEIQEIQSPTRIVVSNAILFHDQRPVLIADCEHAEVHDILNIEQLAKGYLITLDVPLKYTYPSLAYIGEWLEEKWFIKSGKQGIPRLYYKLVQAEELTSLIHSLQISNEQKHHNQLIKIEMGLDKGKTQQLTVAVRGS